MEDQQNEAYNKQSEEHFDLKKCYNCDIDLPLEAKFCSNCGQKYTTGKIPVSQFIYNFFKNTFNIDAKLPKTLANLLIFPGKLTNEFFKGKHQSYLKPMQLFVFMTLLCFTIMVFQTNSLNTKWTIDGEEKQIQPNVRFNEGENHIHFLRGIDTTQMIIDSLLTVAKKEINSSEASTVLDTIFEPWLVQDSLLTDSMTLPVSLQPGNEHIIKISKKDLALLSEKELVKVYNIDGFFSRMLFIQVLKSVKHEDELIDYFIGHLSWTFFLLVPLFALILKLVYIRRKQFYVEHLVFTLHFHAFAFTLTLLFLLFRHYLPISVIGIMVCYLPIYLLISMKKVYKQSTFKTLFKYILLAISYFFLFLLTLMITMAIAFVLF